jgi:hypothetical protein
LYKKTTGEKISRKDFLFKLAEELASEFQSSRTKSDDSDLSVKSEMLTNRKRRHIRYYNNKV